MKTRPIATVLLLLTATICSAATYKISGIITDEETGNPVEGASVSFKLKGKLYASMSDSLGIYQFSLPEKNSFRNKSISYCVST